MVRLRKQLPAHLGEGELHFGGFSGPVAYEVLGEPSSLRLGPLRLRGSFTATPEVAANAFRAGEARVGAWTDGAKVPHHPAGPLSRGPQTAYFEMRI